MTKITKKETETRFYNRINAVRLVKESHLFFDKEKISSSKDAADYARKFYSDDLLIYESVFLILMNRSNETDGFVRISQGGVSSTVVDIRLIAKYAIDTLASGVILVHNHPSNNGAPSEADITLTMKCKEALKLFDIKLFDHIILTEVNHLSMADEGII